MKKFVSIMIAVLLLATGSIALFGQAAQTTEKLVSGTYIVYAKSPQAWRFTVDPKNMANATVVGHYAITVGMPPNADVFVFNEENYFKWRSEDDAVRATAKPLYAANKKTEGDLDVRLSEPGHYYVVFSDLFEYEGKKTLTADIKLQYEKR